MPVMLRRMWKLTNTSEDVACDLKRHFRLELALSVAHAVSSMTPSDTSQQYASHIKCSCTRSVRTLGITKSCMLLVSVCRLEC